MRKWTETHLSVVTVRKAKVNKIMNIIESIGKTPLVELQKVTQGLDAQIFLKSEFFNPLASVKDRIGAAMIEAADWSKIGADKVQGKCPPRAVVYWGSPYHAGSLAVKHLRPALTWNR